MTGEELRTKRHKLKWGQMRLAAKVGLRSTSTVSHWEHGYLPVPDHVAELVTRALAEIEDRVEA